MNEQKYIGDLIVAVETGEDLKKTFKNQAGGERHERMGKLSQRTPGSIP